MRIVLFEADVEHLKVGESPGTEPALDLSGILGVPLLGFVETDEREAEAEGGAMVVGENLGDEG
jgi:hypothetical protein